MIYVSSSCVKAKSIKNAVIKLKDNGFFNIELSVGTQYYEDLVGDLVELKNKYNLNFLLHNYFPPPERHFVVNLASLDNSIYERSVAALKNSIDLCKSLKARKFGLHAGFFTDIHAKELGKAISRRTLYDREEALKRFCSGFRELKRNSQGVKLYIENNVFLSGSRRPYLKINPFMLTSYSDFSELKKAIDFNLLIDFAHLKISCNALGLDFSKELNLLMPYSDYLHLSAVKQKDHHKPFSRNSFLLRSLKDFDLAKKTITLEISASMDELKRSYNAIRKELQ